MTRRGTNGVKLIGWGLTDTGRKRSHNEDNFLVDNEHHLFAVADGMGGHRGGATASRMAMEILGEQVAQASGDIDNAAAEIAATPAHVWALADTDVRMKAQADPRNTLPVEMKHSSLADTDLAFEPTMEFSSPPAVTVMAAAAEQASDKIYQEALSNPELQGMGTTLTAVLFHETTAYVIHAGDSRAYLFRESRLEQLTEDHTWIAEQLKAGVMTEEEAKTSKYRHVITRSVGFEPSVNVDTLGLEVEVGDCFLLCSDGVSNHIEDDEIESIMKNTWFRQIPERLIGMANERGGDDNITVVTVYVGNHTTARPAPSEPAPSEPAPSE